MKAEKQHKEANSRVIQPSKGGERHIVDNRLQPIKQVSVVDSIFQKADKRHLQEDFSMNSHKTLIVENGEMLQLKPVKVDNEGHYCDDEYTDVLFEEVSIDEYTKGYKIISDKCKDTILIYDIDVPAYYTPNYELRFEIQNASGISLGLKSKYDAASIGRGLAFVNEDTTLRISGLITCVGWVIYNDKAAYATHIVVGDPENVNGSNIKEQVENLKSVFESKTSTSPNRVLIYIVDAQPAYKEGKAWKSGWMKELIPSGCTPEWRRGGSSFDFTIAKADEVSAPITWECDPIEIKYNEI